MCNYPLSLSKLAQAILGAKNETHLPRWIRSAGKDLCRRCSTTLPAKQLVQKGDGWAANAACSKRSCMFLGSPSQLTCC